MGRSTSRALFHPLSSRAITIYFHVGFGDFFYLDWGIFWRMFRFPTLASLTFHHSSAICGGFYTLTELTGSFPGASGISSPSRVSGKLPFFFIFYSPVSFFYVCAHCTDWKRGFNRINLMNFFWFVPPSLPPLARARIPTVVYPLSAMGNPPEGGVLDPIIKIRSEFSVFDFDQSNRIAWSFVLSRYN